MDKSLKILILEDVPDDVFFIEHELKKSGMNFQLQKTDSRQSFISALNSFQPDIILSDHSLPDINSMEALDIIKDKADIPFILVTGTVSEEFAVYSLKKGADDYLLKGNLKRLPAAIEAVIRQKKYETERNDAIGKLSKSELHFRRLIENSSDIIITIDKNKTITFASPSVYVTLGFDPAELTGKIFNDCICAEDRTLAETIITHAMSTKEVFYSEWRFMDKEGQCHYLESIGKYDTENNIIILNSRDVTFRKETEKELKVKNAELQKINEELDQFVYSTSHDLRAPLKSILGLINLAFHDLENKELDAFSKYLSMMRKSIHKLDDTIVEIIHYSKNSRSDVVSEEINMREFIDEILEKFAFRDNSSHIKKTVQIDEGWPLISDKQRLSVILSNLIDNALKYSKQQKYEPFISIKIAINANEAIFIIEDNGIGIKELYQDKIYDMFYRATEMSEGSGLGLYIVKEIIDKMGGTIKMISVVNTGTTFTVTLPNNI